MARDTVNLKRTAFGTFRYYARTRTSKTIATVLTVGLLAGAGVWQYPNITATVEGWAAGLSGRDDVVAAQTALGDALNDAEDVIEDAPSATIVSLDELAALIEQCTQTRQSEDITAMHACATDLAIAARSASTQLDREATATQIVALEAQAAEAQARRDAEAAAAAAAAEAERKAAEEAAKRQAAEEAARKAEEARRQAEQAKQNQQPPANPGGNTGGGGNSGGGGGARLSTTVSCNAKQNVTATATGGGTVTVTISGAGSASNTGQGSATATATGQGVFTIVATSTGGGLSLNPSWTGACW